MEENFIKIDSITCTSCGNSTIGYYSKNGAWWDEFVEDDEKICLSCIKDRPGFRDKWDEMIGIPISLFISLY